MTALYGRRVRAYLGGFALASSLAFLAACGSDTTVSPTPTPTPTPDNTPPVISSLTAGSQRAEAGENLTLTSVVLDSQTAPDQLVYDWSASPVSGTFTGTGRQVSWRPPFLQVPGVYTLTLRVTENYTANGVGKQNSVSSNVQVHYNDSYQDINTISKRFLTQLFPDYSVSAAQAVQDFSSSTVTQPDGTRCSDGKASEFSDISNNRVNFHIWSGTYAISSITLNDDRTFGDVLGTCVFEDTPMNPSDPNYQKRERVTGTCHLTVVYENWNWFLCQSHFAGIGVVPVSLRGRVPGQIVSPEEAARWRRR
jgi:hypothetical protein